LSFVACSKNYLIHSSNSRCNKSDKGVINKALKIRGGGLEELANIDWRYFVAGGVCAATSHGITTPIGMIK
jgi:hypothetical protein